MGRPRTPSNVLALRGAHKKHPERARERANEPEASGDIGPAPESLSPEAKACWDEIVRVAHAGTLSSGDRLVVEYGAQLLATLRAAKWDVPSALLARWEGFLSKLGMTPADRSRVSVGKPKEEADPLDEFAAG